VARSGAERRRGSRRTQNPSVCSRRALIHLPIASGDGEETWLQT